MLLAEDTFNEIAMMDILLNGLYKQLLVHGYSCLFMLVFPIGDFPQPGKIVSTDGGTGLCCCL